MKKSDICFIIYITGMLSSFLFLFLVEKFDEKWIVFMVWFALSYFALIPAIPLEKKEKLEKHNQECKCTCGFCCKRNIN